MRSKAFYRSVLSLFALIVCAVAAPQVMRADPDYNKLVVQRCKELAASPEAGTDCYGKCVSVHHKCWDEKTGEYDPNRGSDCWELMIDFRAACGLPDHP